MRLRVRARNAGFVPFVLETLRLSTAALWCSVPCIEAPFDPYAFDTSAL